jgi:hypothetical protein
MVALKVFISYAHEDEPLRRELQKHLSVLRRQGLIEYWHDREILPGSDWAGEIDKQIDEADLIMLLISADFLASDYCYEIEMKRALERHKANEAHVIPIILREVDWQGAPFGKLQALPEGANPVTSSYWPNRDEAFANVAKGIRIRALSEASSPFAIPQSASRIEENLGPSVEELAALGRFSLSISSLEYFCYISESKVNQLLAQLPNLDTQNPVASLQEARRVVELRQRMIKAKTDSTIDVDRINDELKQLEAKRSLTTIKYGAGVFDPVRQALGLEDIGKFMPKFYAVLRHLLSKERVLDLSDALSAPRVLDAFCYYYTGAFHFQEHAGPEMAVLASRSGEYDLRLHCSMKYFSAMGYGKDRNGRFYATPTSMNAAFFDKDRKLDYQFKSFLFITSVKDETISGSPLCLILAREGLML